MLTRDVVDSNNMKLMIDENYLFVAKSRIDATSEILTGRPSGGVATMYKKSLAKDVTVFDTV